MRLAAAFICLLALVGCERPLVDSLERPVEVIGVDLGEVRTDPTLQLALRVQGASALTVNGDSATFGAGLGLFSETLTLARGVNQLVVRAFDGTGVVATDTLVALYLPLAAVPALAFGLPAGRTEAAVVTVPGSRVLVTGGVGASGAAFASTVVLVRQGGLFAASEAPLLTPRAGHTASVLPDGGVLLIGGATVETPARSGDFVPTVEWLPAGSTQSQPVGLPAGAPRRAGHTARVLETGGRTVVYLYGGLVPAGAAVAPSGTVDVFEWLPQTTQLRRLSPDGGAGAFAPVVGHVQVPLAAGTSAPTGRLTDVVFGGDPAAGSGQAVALRFDFTTPGSNFPFDVAARDAAPLSVPRTDAAGVALGGGLALVVGGRDRAGTALGSIEVYAAQANQTFRVPDGVRLAAPRSGASATLFPDGRILVVGGRTLSGAASNAVEVFVSDTAP